MFKKSSKICILIGMMVCSMIVTLFACKDKTVTEPSAVESQAEAPAAQEVAKPAAEVPAEKAEGYTQPAEEEPEQAVESYTEPEPEEDSAEEEEPEEDHE